MSMPLAEMTAERLLLRPVVRSDVDVCHEMDGNPDGLGVSVGLEREFGRLAGIFMLKPLGLDRIVAVVCPDNEASLRVVARLGMEPVGELEICEGLGLQFEASAPSTGPNSRARRNLRPLRTLLRCPDCTRARGRLRLIDSRSPFPTMRRSSVAGP